jgi:hypothetical protein
MNKNLPKNSISDPEKILRKARSKLRSPDSQPRTFALGDSTARSLTSTFEVMANKSLREYYAPTLDNICTGPTDAVGNAAFELKPTLINMVQASQFCGKAHANTFKISWRYVAPSRSKMFQVMQSYFVYSHSHY